MRAPLERSRRGGRGRGVVEPGVVLWQTTPGVDRVVFEDCQVVSGWEKMLEALIASGWAVTGTWPMRTEMSTRAIGQGTNALASSIVLVCRPISTTAGITDRPGFVRSLKNELGE